MYIILEKSKYAALPPKVIKGQPIGQKSNMSYCPSLDWPHSIHLG
jgi:hypothetical protein